MPEKISVLVVDDDLRLLRFVRANLESVGYRVLVAEDGAKALEIIQRECPDLIILDIMLPEMDGLEVCRRVREFSTIPIIMLTAKVEEAAKVQGLRLGADDYLTKPFGVEELLARVEAVLRRTKFPDEIKASAILELGDMVIDFLRRRVTVRGQEIELTPTEYRLLYHLASNVGKVMFHEELLTKVWGSDYRQELDYLRAYIRHLRRKIEEDPSQPKYILSRPGIGYMLVNPG